MTYVWTPEGCNDECMDGQMNVETQGSMYKGAENTCPNRHTDVPRTYKCTHRHTDIWMDYRNINIPMDIKRC